MALDFPSSPSLNQIISSEGLEYIWNGTAWVGYSSEISYPQANLTNIDAVNIDVTGITTSVNLDVTNGTIDYLNITQANVSGTTTSLNLDVTNGTIDYFTATHSNVSGVSSATNLDVTNGTIDYFTATQANVSGTTTSLNVDVTNGTVDYLTATQVNVSGVVTATTFDGNVTGDVLGNLTGNVNSSGVSTFSNVVVGGATTDLVVVGDARITGILTIGTSSITLSGSDNTIKIGTGLTLTAAGGANYSGIVTALAFFGDGTNIDISSNPNNGVGLGTVGGIVGYAVTQLNLFGTGISTSFATSGIATVYINSGNVPIGNTFPSSPKNGDLFYNIDYGRTYIYYDEVALGVGLAAFWVDAAPFNNIIEANYALVAGISTYASVAGVATVAQNLTGGPNVQVGRIRATGITTFERNSEFQQDVRIDGTLRVGTGVTINSGVVTAISFTKYGGTSSQFLKADGSVDSSTYLTSAPESYWVSTAAGIHTLSNVGVGTTNPTSKLDVYGDITISGNGWLYDSTDSNYYFRPTNWQLKGGGYITESNAVNGYIQIGEKYIYGYDDITKNDFNIQSNGNSYFRGGNLGVGTTNPTSTFTVDGTVNVTGLSTFQDNVRISNTDSKLFVGQYTSPYNSQIELRNINGYSYLYHYGAQTLHIALASGSTNKIQFDTISKIMCEMYRNGSVNLYYDGSQKFQTTNDGAVVTGILTATSVGIGTTNAPDKLTVIDGDISVGINTAHGVVLTSANGTRYRLIVGDDGSLSTTAV